MSRDAEASTAGAPGISRMTQTNSRSARDLKGVVGSGVEILGVVAAVTQAVPYLGIISGSLTEIIKIYNEVDKFKSEWRSVLDDVSRLKTIVDTVRDELNRSRDEDKRLPPGLVEPLEELEKCISETRRTMDNCKPDVAEGLQRKHLGRLKARGLRVARVVLNRKDLLDSVNRCRANMSTMLHVFNARLNVSHAFALDHQLQRFDNIIVASVDSEENLSLPARDGELASLANTVDPTGSPETIIGDGACESPETTFRLQVSLTVPASVRVKWSIALNQIRHVVSRFTAEDQDTIWRGLAVLVLGTLEAGNGVNGQAMTAPAAYGSVCVTEFLETVIPMVCMFLLLFMIWKLHSVTRPLGWPGGNVIVVDFLGRAFELHADTFSTWENTHAFLVEAFQGQHGAPFVNDRAYGLGNSDRLLITPEDWTEAVQPGAKLQMSAIIREEPHRCPYCQAVFDAQEVSETTDRRMICPSVRCGRSYGILRDETDLAESEIALSSDERPDNRGADSESSSRDLKSQHDPVAENNISRPSQPGLKPGFVSLGLINSIVVLFREMNVHIKNSAHPRVLDLEVLLTSLRQLPLMVPNDASKNLQALGLCINLAACTADMTAESVLDGIYRLLAPFSLLTHLYIRFFCPVWNTDSRNAYRDRVAAFRGMEINSIAERIVEEVPSLRHLKLDLDPGATLLQENGPQLSSGRAAEYWECRHGAVALGEWAEGERVMGDMFLVQVIPPNEAES